MPASGVELKHTFSDYDFSYGLCKLDEQVTQSRNLRKALPLRIIALRDYVSVTRLGTRDTATQMLYMSDPFPKARAKLSEKLRHQVEAVADDCAYASQWMAEAVDLGMSDEHMRELWQDSMAQGAVIWSGKNITVYAPLWEWLFNEKMRILALESPHADQQDIDDAVAILFHLNKKHRGTLLAADLAHWQRNVQPPIRMGMYHNLSEAYRAKYEKPGLLFERR
ncbi:hypothetical protein KEM52_001370 [Ascosphaera acerosa]|nr:hypothetical protein KEM52_001370 [Ascosphaera acerosa]